MRALCRLSTLLLIAPLVFAADRIQFVSGGDRIVPGPDGTLFLTGIGQIETTPGAYQPSSRLPAYFIQRIDAATGRLVYATYLDFALLGASADAKGALYLYGKNPAPEFSITPGAYDRRIQGGEQLVIAKLTPSGAAMEFATLLGGSFANGAGELRGIAVGPDGSVFVAGRTCSKDFPITSDAFQTALRSAAAPYGCDAFLSVFSRDGSQLLYSTFLGGSDDSFAAGISFGEDGRLRIVGGTRAKDFPRLGDFDLPVAGSLHQNLFVTTWDPILRRFTTVATVGEFLWPQLVAWNGNRVAIAAFDVDDPLTSLSQPLWPVLRNNEAVLVLDTNHWRSVYAIGVRTSDVYGLALDADGSLIVAGSGDNAIPASPGAHSLYGSNFAARLDATGRHSVAATYFDLPLPRSVFGAAITPETIYIPFRDPGAPFPFPPFPIMPNPTLPAKCAMIQATPKIVEQCGADLLTQAQLRWDACDPSVEGAEVRVGAPDGPLLSRSTSGQLSVPPLNTTYFLVDPRGHTLAMEEVSYRVPPRCADVPSPSGELRPQSNDEPRLSCVESPLTGTETTLYGAAPNNSRFPFPVELHVLRPDGPKVAYSRAGAIGATTGDWVRDGTAFFLTTTDLTPLAMCRAFLLPIRSCSNPNLSPPPAIQVKPSIIDQCGRDRNATLAWYSARIHPVEIRESTATGKTVARFDQWAGLLDVTPAGTTTYHLVGYVDGEWKDLASDTVRGNPFCPAQ